MRIHPYVTPIRTCLSLVFSAAILLGTGGCGGGDASSGGEDASEMDAASEQEQEAVAMEPLGSASVSGAVAYTGPDVERRRVRQDPECDELNPEPVQTEAVIVNENGTLRNVFVYVKSGLDEYTFPTPSELAIFDQRGCMYKPHVFGVQTGQTIKILNSDPLLHNIHALPEKNRGFNFGMPRQGDERERSFMTPEVMVKIKCDVHPWMSAWAGVLDHPYFDVTGEDGSYSIEGLPAGTYELEAWHEEFGTKTQTVTVAEGEAVTGEFSYSGAGSAG